MMHWDDWADRDGQCYACFPYVIREYEVIDGIMHWQLEGGGLHCTGTDPDLLKMEAEQHHDRRQRTAVGLLPARADIHRVGHPPVASIDPNEWLMEIRELQSSVRQLMRLSTGVNPYEHRAITSSRATLEDARDVLQHIIERLP